MSLEFVSIRPDELARYGAISIAFEAETWLRPTVVDGGLGGVTLIEEPLATPLHRDYDAEPSEPPEALPGSGFDLSYRDFVLAIEGGRDVGAATLLVGDLTYRLLDGRSDVAVLQDLRVATDDRGRGVGTALFAHMAEMARKRGLAQLKIETQNVNPRACHFYRLQGCVLGGVARYAYAGDPVAAEDLS